MPNNPLPNPIPAGSRLYSNADDAEKIECHDIDRPLHVLTDGQAEAVRVALTHLGYYPPEPYAAFRCLRNAFAPIFEAPKVKERKTCRATLDALEISFHAHIAEIKRRRSEGVFRNRVPLHPFYVERLGEWQCRDKDDKVFHVERGGRVDCEERCDAFNIYYGYTSDGKDILEGMEE